MRDVYAAQFTLTTADALDHAAKAILDWALERYPDVQRREPFPGGSVVISPTDAVEWAVYQSDSDSRRAWSLMLRHVDHQDSSLGWRVMAQLTEPDGPVRFTLRISQESLEPRVRPALDIPGRPRIVRELARITRGTIDGLDLSEGPRQIRSDDVESLVRHLTDPARRLPVVVTTVRQETGRPSVDPVQLADHLIGIAHVDAIVTAPATYELTEQLGRSVSVFDGAVRIYWPGFLPDADPYIHRLWLGRTVELIDQRVTRGGRRFGFAQHLLGLIGDVAALRIPPDPVVRAYRRSADARIRAAEREEWANRIAEQASSVPDEFAEEFDRMTSRIEELELELAIAEEERGQLEADKARMARSFADIHAAVDRERAEASDLTLTPSTIPEALALLASQHPHAVVVLPDAYGSAEATRYPQIERAAAALRAIGEVAEAWHNDTLGRSFDEAFQEQGFELRTVSPVTRGRYPSYYAKSYRGERVPLGPHLALGSGGSTDTIFRVYWYLDETVRCFVIGHVGRHLPDTTN